MLLLICNFTVEQLRSVILCVRLIMLRNCAVVSMLILLCETLFCTVWGHYVFWQLLSVFTQTVSRDCRPYSARWHSLLSWFGVHAFRLNALQQIVGFCNHNIWWRCWNCLALAHRHASHWHVIHWTWNLKGADEKLLATRVR